MLSEKVFQGSARRFALQRPLTFVLPKALSPAATLTQARTTASVPHNTSATSEASASQILINQRLHRPITPHLTIYRPQITWINSALNRITGSILSVGLYGFGVLYLLASVSGGATPLFGLSMTSTAMAAGFAKWPVALKVFTKMMVALPFTFHSFNGVRHLVWDLALQMTNLQVARTGWTVLGLTVLTSLGLAVLV